MKILVAIYSPLVAAWCVPEETIDWLRAEFPAHTLVRADSDEETLAAIGGADVAFSAQIKPAHLAAAATLRWIHSPAAGVGGMLFPEMIRSQVVMTNSRGTSAVTIAEHTIAVTLALLRDLPFTLQQQAAHRWAQNELHARGAIRLLRDAHTLVVGVGAIGGETARLMASFGARVTGIRRRLDQPLPPGVTEVLDPARLHDVLPRLDVVVLAAPQTPATDRLIGARELALMKRDAVLVNVSRGRLVDEDALVAALAGGRLRGAALDVFDEEPLPATSPLWSRADVLITPHVSAFHADFWPDLAALFADNLRRFIAGQPLRNIVDKAAGY